MKDFLHIFYLLTIADFKFIKFIKKQIQPVKYYYFEGDTALKPSALVM